ncbi:unnamed protein product [Euphydryas editha]|uniref:Transposable element P transposase-like RNase H C-terminal domain-containing protein n=1 Tax=Euphydryas editha TaxID=104508 RepID=A0AAU9VGA6_EUPED|nr:unnamed protein product [Euphydryas editha]
MPSEAIATASLITKMDMLFDSVHASTPDLKRGKKNSTKLKESTGYITLFREIKELFKNLNFFECRSTPPSKEGWVWTFNGLELVRHYITKKHKTVKSLSTRRIQQDPLEILFGFIRANCGSNSNPTTSQFVAGLKLNFF